MMKYIRTVISILLCLTASWGVQAGQIFVTGHDPIWHLKGTTVLGKADTGASRGPG